MNKNSKDLQKQLKDVLDMAKEAKALRIKFETQQDVTSEANPAQASIQKLRSEEQKSLALARILADQIQRKEAVFRTPLEIKKFWESCLVTYEMRREKLERQKEENQQEELTAVEAADRNKKIEEEIKEIKQEEYSGLKITLCDIMCQLYSIYSKKPTIQPAHLLQELQKAQPTFQDELIPEMYQDLITSENIQIPICITEHDATKNRHYYYDLKTVVRMLLLEVIVLPQHRHIMRSKDLSAYSTENLLEYIQDYLDKTITSGIDQGAVSMLRNPLTTVEITPASISVVDPDDYLKELHKLYEEYNQAWPEETQESQPALSPRRP